MYNLDAAYGLLKHAVVSFIDTAYSMNLNYIKLQRVKLTFLFN